VFLGHVKSIQLPMQSKGRTRWSDNIAQIPC